MAAREVHAPGVTPEQLVEDVRRAWRSVNVCLDEPADDIPLFDDDV